MSYGYHLYLNISLFSAFLNLNADRLFQSIFRYSLKYLGCNACKLVFHTPLKTRFKITHLEKMHFIKVNELKLTEVEFFYFFHFMCIVANAAELFYMAHLAKNELLL